MSNRHVVYEPEWVIDEKGGGFRVECECGWSADGFDTITLARSRAFDHSASGAALMPERQQSSSTDAADAPAPARRRWWQR